MIVTKTHADANTLRTRQEGKAGAGLIGYATTFIGRNRLHPGTGPEPVLGELHPSAHLVEQDPGTALKPHYHQADQFQVVVAGGGYLGPDHVQPYSVHYTNSGTPYGPIKAGDEGLSYFTLRNSYDPGPKVMPESRPHLKAMDRNPREETAERTATASVCEGVEGAFLGPFPDGLAAWYHTMSPGQVITGPKPADGRGQFWLTLKGRVRAQSAELAEWSCLFASPDEAPVSAIAENGPAAVLIVQFPRRG